jgi:hypothetical protein
MQLFRQIVSAVLLKSKLLAVHPHLQYKARRK